MADLNTLLRWSIENSTPRDPNPNANANGSVENGTSNPNEEEQLTLKFTPTQTPGAGSTALHPSDPHYRADDESPASTPGPATPVAGSGGGGLPHLPTKRNDLTSEMLDLIMGKPDSVVMKEKMAFAMDETNSLEERVEALDDFEMLIESIDNANNMPVLKLWDPLLKLLSSQEPEIVTNALWIIGTAVQNNIKAQAALYVFDALPLILSILYSPNSTHSPAVRSKATYALSSALKHWPLASSALSANNDQGWNTLKSGVRDDSPIVRRKMAFLINTLVAQDGDEYSGEIPKEVQEVIESKSKGSVKMGLVDGLRKFDIFTALLSELEQEKAGEDIEFQENAMRALASASGKHGLSDEEKTRLKGIWEGWGETGREERGLGGEDGKDIQKALA